ncbi:hypothetical protein CRENBAI_006131 [Crenichthys baileyi]|uniref:Uncharacterized protein n=1 Tax=Crenichthys baileyi TaxID=28760 RepID=A0AAV9S5L4_9TELE
MEPSQAMVPPELMPHILPYIGRGTVKTTNPKHTPPTRNHPADKQTPPQCKAEKPGATAEPSDARPACTHVKRRPTASRSKNIPNSHTPARSCPTGKPTPKPTKGREPTEPKPKPTKKPRPVHPEINPGQPARPNHADPSDPPPPDRTGTGVRDRNPDKEPESEPEPPRSRRCSSPPKANHPPPPQKKTYTHPNIRTALRTHKTLDTQVDSAPSPSTDHPPRQQRALLEGESTCNEMVPTHQFRRPLRPPMHRRPLGSCWGARACADPKPQQYTWPDPRPPSPPSPGATRPRNPEPPRSPQTRPGAAWPAAQLTTQAKAPQKHCMQPPDAAPKTYQSPYPVGATALVA